MLHPAGVAGALALSFAQNGRLLVPAWGMRAGFKSLADWNAVVLISEPRGGASWRVVHVPDTGHHEPNELQCAELPSGVIYANVCCCTFSRASIVLSDNVRRGVSRCSLGELSGAHVDSL